MSIRKSILGTLLLAAALISAVSCKDDRKKDGQVESYKFQSAEANYYSSVEGYAVGQFEISFSGRDSRSVLYLNTKQLSSLDNVTLPVGDYTAVDEASLRAGTFIRGKVSQNGLTGSYLYISDTDEYIPMSSGTVKISSKNSRDFSIEISFTAYGKKYRATYDGAIVLNAYEKCVDFAAANLEYYGDYYGTGTSNYYLSLYNGTFDEDGYFVGEAKALYLDIMMPLSDKPAIPTGTFPCVLNKNYTTVNCFNATSFYTYTLREYLEELEAGGSLIDWSEYTDTELSEQFVGAEGSYYEEQDAKENTAMTGIESGTLTISLSSTGSYSVEVQGTCDEGKKLKFTYNGLLKLVDYSDEGGDDDDGDFDFTRIPQDVVMNNIDYVSCANYGDYYGKGNSDWCIFLYVPELQDKTDPNGYLNVQLEVLGSKTATTLPTGTFNVSNSMATGTAVAYFEDDEYACGCTLWVGDENLIYGADSGTVTISKSGSSYTITFDLKDTEYDGTFKGSYTGAVVDDTDNVVAAHAQALRKAPKMSASRKARALSRPAVRQFSERHGHATRVEITR